MTSAHSAQSKRLEYSGGSTDHQGRENRPREVALRLVGAADDNHHRHNHQRDHDDGKLKAGYRGCQKWTGLFRFKVDITNSAACYQVNPCK